MNKLLLSLLGLLFINEGYSQLYMLKDFGINHKLISFTEFESNSTNSIITKNGIDSTTHYFNNDNWVDSIINYYKGKEVAKVIFQYENEKILREKITGQYMGNSLDMVRTYKYHGDTITRTILVKDTILKESSYRVIKTDTSEIMLSKNVKTIDRIKGGHKMKTDVFMADTLFQTDTYSYNEFGNQTSHFSEQPNDQDRTILNPFVYEYSYDKKTNWIERKSIILYLDSKSYLSNKTIRKHSY